MAFGKIRRYEEADFAAVYAIWLEGDIDKHWFVPDWNWRDSKARVLAGIAEAEEIWVWQERKTQQIWGVIALDGCEVRALFVDMGHIGESVGGGLLRFAKQGRESLYVQEFEENVQHMRLYARNHFYMQPKDWRVSLRNRDTLCTMVWQRQHKCAQ